MGLPSSDNPLSSESSQDVSSESSLDLGAVIADRPPTPPPERDRPPPSKPSSQVPKPSRHASTPVATWVPLPRPRPALFVATPCSWSSQLLHIAAQMQTAPMAPPVDPAQLLHMAAQMRSRAGDPPVAPPVAPMAPPMAPMAPPLEQPASMMPHIMHTHSRPPHPVVDDSSDDSDVTESDPGPGQSDHFDSRRGGPPDFGTGVGSRGHKRVRVGSGDEVEADGAAEPMAPPILPRAPLPPPVVARPKLLLRALPPGVSKITGLPHQRTPRFLPKQPSSPPPVFITGITIPFLTQPKQPKVISAITRISSRTIPKVIPARYCKGRFPSCDHVPRQAPGEIPRTFDARIEVNPPNPKCR